MENKVTSEAHRLLRAKVMHRRLRPKENQFVYGVYYYALRLSALASLPVRRNRFSYLSFYDQDHGPRDGGSLETWIRDRLTEYGLAEVADGEIILICMPRVFGYVFNPVSFWCVQDKKGDLRAVLCEVNNTFGETHSYLCAHQDHRPIVARDTLVAKKLFHVSPFLEREGHYEFRFDWRHETFGVWIHHTNAQGEIMLLTSLTGRYQPLSRSSALKAFLRYPMVTFKTVALIHWQALKLILKGIKHISKPRQQMPKLSATEKITKM